MTTTNPMFEAERCMGRSYSEDLRKQVVDAAASTSRRQAAARFGVGVATAIRWMAAVAQTGTVAALPQGRPRRSKLEPHEAFLRALIDDQAGITLEGMRARLLADRDCRVAQGTLWRFLNARGLTSGKRHGLSPDGSGPA